MNGKEVGTEVEKGSGGRKDVRMEGREGSEDGSEERKCWKEVKEGRT